MVRTFRNRKRTESSAATGCRLGSDFYEKEKRDHTSDFYPI